MSLIIDMVITSSKAPVVTENNDGSFDVRVFEPSEYDLFAGFDARDAVSFFGEETILKAIDEDNAAKYYGLISRATQYELEDEIERLKAEIELLKNTQVAETVEVDRNYIDFTE